MLASAAGVAISVLTLAHIEGGIRPVIEILYHIKEAMPTNAYAVKYQSGPWYSILQGFWIISPLNAFLCVFGIAGALFGSLPKDKNQDPIFGIIFFMIAFMAISIATPYCQNLRYVSVLFVPFYLMAGLGLWHIVSFIKLKMKNASFYIAIPLSIVIILAAAGDYRRFKKIFLKTCIMDVSIQMLRDYSR